MAGEARPTATAAELDATLPGQISHERTPHSLYANESLGQALRRLTLYGRDGLPVLSADGSVVEGWVTNSSALDAIARDLGARTSAAARGELESELAAAHQTTDRADSPSPLKGFRVIEVLLDEHSPAIGSTLGSVRWPEGHTPVSLLRRRVLHEADPRLPLAAGDSINILVDRRQRAGGGEHADASGAVDNADSA